VLRKGRKYHEETNHIRCIDGSTASDSCNFSPERSRGPDDIIDSYRWKEVYVVKRGDTLWEIAEEINSDLDPRLMVAAIKKVNEIETMIRVNQKIVIPEK
jgi:nucleoid-associated protein YgaU